MSKLLGPEVPVLPPRALPPLTLVIALVPPDASMATTLAAETGLAKVHSRLAVPLPLRLFRTGRRCR